MFGPDYKSHNALDSGGGEGGVPSGVCDLGASRPEVPEGPLWSWRSPAVSPRAVTAPTPPPRALVVTAHPVPEPPVPSHVSGGGKMGGVMEELEIGRTKSRLPGRDLGSSRTPGLERLLVEARGQAASGWGQVGCGAATRGDSRLSKGGV